MRMTSPSETAVAGALSRGALLGLVLAGSLLFPSAARGEKKTRLEESDKLPVVQNRLFRMEHELNLGVGVLPVDPFYKAVALSAGYGWHINDMWAVEAHFSYLLKMKTDLREKLENNLAIPTTRFPELVLFGELGALFKPIYGKLSLLNRTLVYGELFLSLCLVGGEMTGGKGDEEDTRDKGERIAIGGAPGFGFRVFLSPRISLRFDFRYILLYSGGEGYYPLSLSLLFAFTPRSDL